MANNVTLPWGLAAGFPGQPQLATQELTAGVHALKVTNVDSVGGITNGKSATLDDLADATLNTNVITVLVAADATRREAIIVADVGNTVAIRIGGPNVSATRGAALQPGQSTILTTAAAINGWAVPAAQKVSITLVKD